MPAGSLEPGRESRSQADTPVPMLDDGELRRVAPRDRIRSVHEHYGGTLILSETSHWDVHRACWLST